MKRGYPLAVLLAIMTLTSADTVAMGLLLQSIKVDLGLSDTQLGLLTGIAFGLFYAIVGLPIGRWADQGNRVTIIAIAATLWSAMLSLCVFVGNFIQLFFIRVGAGVGQAGCNPAALSLIADYFGRAERPRAISKSALGWPLSLLIGCLAGWLNQYFGWRLTFLLLGLPGFAAAALVWFSLKEPRLMEGEGTSILHSEDSELADGGGPREDPSSLREVMQGLWASSAARHLLLFWVVAAFFIIGAAQFQAAFLMRSYGLKTGEVSTWFALVSGTCGLVGTYLGGAWASRRAANNERLQLKAAAIAYSGLAFSSACIYLSNTKYWAFGFMGIGSLIQHMPIGPLYGTLQTLVTPRRRATAIALSFLLSNVIGIGLGPLVTGALSDALRHPFGTESLRYALLAFCPGYLWGAWHLWRASKTVMRELVVMQEKPGDLDVGTLHESTARLPVA